MSIVVDGGLDTFIPKMCLVKQIFHAPIVEDIQNTIRSELSKDKIRNSIKPGDRVAVGVGSRGINNLRSIVKYTIDELKQWGAIPFIIPAMGSHGGATAEGQKKVLAELGITEESMGVPIVSSMDVVQIGFSSSGIPVYLDQSASQSDAIIFINRIKPHTSFKGDYESGLLKMMAIGLGRHKGAATVHQRPLDEMPTILPEMAEVYLSHCPIAFGVGILENAYDQTAKIIAVPREEMIHKEKELLIEAKELMPRLLPEKIDVLIVSQMGKNISGSGMDPNITGRAASKAPQKFNAPPIERIVVLGLTSETKGNACGIGVADVTTRRVYNEINLEYTYANVITSKVLDSCKIPMILPDDYTAITIALKTCYYADLNQPRIVLIKNTLELETIWVSEAMLPEVDHSPYMERAGTPTELMFHSNGHLDPIF
jgi:hypothetical protein